MGADVVNSVKGRAHQYYTSKVQEYAVLNFDLEAGWFTSYPLLPPPPRPLLRDQLADNEIDLSSLFNWNTKQVFAYVSATYPGSKYVCLLPPRRRSPID